MTGHSTPWLHSLYEKEVFREALNETYRTVFLPLLEELLSKTIAEYEQILSAAFERNRIRWNVETRGLAAEADYIVSYLQERTEFLTQLWLEDQAFCIVRLREHQDSGYYAYYAVKPGTVFTDLPQRSGEGFLGWYREDTDTLFDPAEPITEDVHLYPKYTGYTEEREDHAPDIMDLFLEVYHYVPAGVLLIIGTAAAVAAACKRPAGKNERQRSKT